MYIIRPILTNQIRLDIFKSISGLSIFNLLSKKLKPITSTDVTPLDHNHVGSDLIMPPVLGGVEARGLDPTGTYRVLQGNKAKR